VVSLPRVVKVADVVSILRGNEHNGFPVSFASTLLLFLFLVMLWPISEVFFLTSTDLGDRSHKKWGNTCQWTYASQVYHIEFVFFPYM
jgi:hypothetical protein